jgi:chemotaxis protein MotB
MRRRRKRSGSGGDHDQEISHERWLVSYADFITLMFAFFTVLYATSERNVEKTRDFQESIKRFLIKTGGFGGAAPQINQADRHNEVIETPLPTYKSSRPQDAQVMEVTEKQVEAALTKEDRQKYLMDLFSDDLGVRIVVKGAPLFGAQGAQFKKEALPFLERLGKMFKKIDRRLLIEGHVDEKFNDQKLSEFDLGQQRSLQLARYLVKVHGFSVKKIATASFGSNRPLSSHKDNLNDRVEFVILYEDSPI